MSFPRAWALFDSGALHVDPIGGYGFFSPNGDINRWAARFRAAKSFRKVELEGYSAQTVMGYSALCRVLFTWSAFERFLPLLDLTQDSCAVLFSDQSSQSLADAIRQDDADGKFFGFVYDRANSNHRRELELWRNCNQHNFAYLMSGIRHIFAHGHLTPHANEVDPMVCSKICNSLCDHVIALMDEEFSRRVEKFYE